MIIKRYPEDFQVEEVLTRETASLIAAAPLPFTLYRAAKRGLGTDEAIERVSSRLGLPLERIACAGLKDKHAAAMQHLSIEFPRRRMAQAPELIEAPGITLERIGWLMRPLAADDIAGNRFRIALRDLTRRDGARLDGVRAFLAIPMSRGRRLIFVNYYGEQRFGSARHGRGFAARRLIEGDFEEALKLLIAAADRKDSRDRKSAKKAVAAEWGNWTDLARALPASPESNAVARLAATGGDFRAAFAALPRFMQRMTVEAYQSWLWNEVARRFVAASCRPPFLELPSRFGAFIFPGAEGVPAELGGLRIPLFSPKTALEAPWREAAEEVLAREGITLGDLRIPGLRAPYFGDIPRSLFAIASELSLGPLEPDEASGNRRRFKRRMRFYLPRGSYATTLLSAFEAGAQSIFR